MTAADPARSSARSIDPSPAPVRRWAADWAPFAVFLLLMLAGRDALANHYAVPSGSMQPALQPGDRVAVDMRAYGLRVPFTEIELRDGASPQPGDVVVFDSPRDGTRLIKRVVAVGGQTVAVRAGRLWVDGVALAADADGMSALSAVESLGGRAVWLDLRDGGGPDLAPVRIPEGQVLVLGDHRGNSLDGRYFGLVAADGIYGRALAVFYRSGEGLGWTAL